jgi:hypothetical protein
MDVRNAYGNKPYAVMVNGKPAKECYAEWLERKRILEGILDSKGRPLWLHEYWECEIKETMDAETVEVDGKTQTMRQFFEDRPEKGRINPRDAYSGGRTGPSRLFAKADDEWEISMADIISLYPHVYRFYRLI